MPAIDFTRLLQFNEFGLLSSQAHGALQEAITVTEYKQGSVIIKKGGLKSPELRFLISGTLELRHSFANRVSLSASDADNRQALNGNIETSTTVKAVDDCLLATIAPESLEKLLTMGDHYGIIEIDTVDGVVSETDRIDDSFEKDWQTCFIQSSLAMSLPYEVVLQLFSVMEDVEVSKGQEIVKARTPGDYFYLIKRGEAHVETESTGPFQGASVVLDAGQYFGDEALVANTDRNATVTMASDGLLGRFSADMFNELIRPHLVQTQERQEATAAGTKVLDVRFPVEIGQSLEEGARNIPISKLRKQLSELNPEDEYLVTPANDCRSHLATYLMRQAGFNAFALSEAV